MEEVVGFEPTRLSPTCFQDRRHRPLGDTSIFYGGQSQNICQGLE